MSERESPVAYDNLHFFADGTSADPLREVSFIGGSDFVFFTTLSSDLK